MTENVNKKYLGPQALGAVVRRLLGFNSRIEAAERTVADCAEAERQRVVAEEHRKAEFGRLGQVVAGQSETVEAVSADVRDALKSLSSLETVVTASESLRHEDETNRRSEEEVRRTAEMSRIGSERLRAEAEESRAEAERARDIAEESRSRDEENRISAEESRVKAEEQRVAEFAEIASDPSAKMRLFCDLFSAAAGPFGYARITDGEFDCELNELRLTYEEALNTYFASGEFSVAVDGAYAFNNNIRTLIPRRIRGVSASAAWQSCANLEALVFVDGLFTNLSNAFRSCPKLRKISLIANYNTIDGAFVGCRSLEELTLKGLRHNVSFADSPLLNLTSFEYLIANATNTSTITITVHPDVYAKLTDESNTEWHLVLVDAAEKNIVFATV